MKKVLLLALIVGLFATFTDTYAQYGFGTNAPNPNAIIDAQGSNMGLLIPRIALTGLTDSWSGALDASDVGMTVFNTATSGTFPTNIYPGYYWWAGAAWVRLADALTAYPFSLIATGTNTTATMTVSAGASIVPHATTPGTIEANAYTDGTIVNDDISATAGIVYSKLLFANNIVAGDIAADAIEASELADNSVASANIIDGAIVNADINGSAAIAVTKLAAGTNGQVLLNNAGTNAWGTLAAANVSNVAAGNIVATDVQAAINELDAEKQATGNYITALTGDVTATGPGSATATIAANAVTSAKILDGEIVNADVSATAGIVYSKLLFANNIVAGDIAADAIEASELADNSVASANIIDGAIVNADINGSAAIAVTKLAAGTNGQVLLNNAGTNAWGTLAAANVSNVAAGNIVATDVQAAINELDAEKQATGNYITALTGDVTASGPGSATATISANAVGSSEITDGSVANADLANSTIALTSTSSSLTVTGSPISLGGTAGNLEINTAHANTWTATQTFNSPGVDINAGTIDGASVGATTRSTGAFTTLAANSTVNLTGLAASTEYAALVVNTTSGAVGYRNLSYDALRTETGDYTVAATDGTVLSNNSANVVITLPTPTAALAGKKFIVKKISNNTNRVRVSVAGGGSTIDGATNYDMAVQWQSAVFQNDGTNWFVISLR